MQLRTLFFLLIAVTLMVACKDAPKTATEPTKTPIAEMDDAAIKKLADELAHKYIITDGHVDLPYRLKVTNFRLEKEFLGIPLKTDKGDFDLERAKIGGLDAPFMSIYIPASYQKDGGAKIFADSLIDMVSGIADAHPDKFAITTSTTQDRG